MRRARIALALALASASGACTTSRTEAATGGRAPSIALAPIAPGALCVTRGALEGPTVRAPTLRGYARGAGGDAAQLTFVYHGESPTTRELAGGDARRQLGLKLRAQDSCNVVYVMWRLDPRPRLDVSVKRNPGARTHEECGAGGYTKVRPSTRRPAPALEPGSTHDLRAEISGDELSAWVDGTLLWQGRLPDTARPLRGPAGLRSDNVEFELVELAVPAQAAPPDAPPTPTATDCPRDASGE